MRALAFLVCGFFISGCALTNKADAIDIRYFAPRDSATNAHPAQDGATKELRLGRLRASAHLKSEIVYRESPVKFGVYDDDRWTERPEEYMRRAISQALFSERGVTQAVSGVAPTLDVELLSFEEVRDGTKRSARVTLSYALRDDRVVVEAKNITVERPARGNKLEGVVDAMGDALAAASEELAQDVVTKLAERPAQPTPTPSSSAASR